MSAHLVWFSLLCICTLYCTVYCFLQASWGSSQNGYSYATLLWRTLTSADTTEPYTFTPLYLITSTCILATAATAFIISGCFSNKKQSLRTSRKKDNTRKNREHPRHIFSQKQKAFPYERVPCVAVLVILVLLYSGFYLPWPSFHPELGSLAMVLFLTLTVLIVSSVDMFGNSFLFWRLLWKVITWLFILSIPWEYFRLYRHQVAEQFTHSMKGVPAGCMPSDRSLWGTLRIWLSESFTWSRQNDVCLEYHKALLVHPMWNVTPLMVLSSLVTRCITRPMEIFASSLGTSYRVLFEHIPVQWQPVVMIQLIIITILIVLACMRLSLRIPFILHIQPHYKHSDSQHARSDSITTTRGENSALPAINSHCKSLTDTKL